MPKAVALQTGPPEPGARQGRAHSGSPECTEWGWTPRSASCRLTISPLWPSEWLPFIPCPFSSPFQGCHWPGLPC